MGYFRGLTHGIIIGTLVGLAVAPQTGSKTREQMRHVVDAGNRTFGMARRAASNFAPRAKEGMGNAHDAVDMVRGQVTRSHREAHEAPSNGHHNGAR